MAANANPGKPRRVPARSRILDAAEYLFTRRGVNAVGVDTVIEHAGVAKMTLYNNFSSKEELVVETFERLDNEWFTSLRAAVDRHSKSSKDRPYAFFDALRDWFESPGFRGCPFLNVYAELADQAHPARETCEAHAERLHTFIEQTLRAAGVKITPTLIDELLLITQGAITLAAVTGSSDPAKRAKRIARALIERE